MMRITQNADGSRLHHHGQGELHRKFEPSFRESAENVAMSDLTGSTSERAEKDQAKLYQHYICITTIM